MNEDDPFLGQVLQGYELTELIGQGSVGRVYAAQHTRLGRRLAVKIIRPELIQNERILARFFQESQTVNLIHHENVIEIFDLLYEPEKLLVAIFMERLEGQTLSQALRVRAPFSLPRLGRVALQLCSALSMIHAQGIVHRDLKSDNIFLITRDGRRDFVKIVDFGLVRPQTSLYGIKTPLGTAVGTPLYMPPEQAVGDPVDARSDIYSLGIILYELATGGLPFYSTDSREVMRKQILAPPPPPRNKNPQLTPEVEQLILRCLAKRREGRFSSMGELAAAISSHIDTSQPDGVDLAPQASGHAAHPGDTTEESASTNPESTLEE